MTTVDVWLKGGAHDGGMFRLTLGSDGQLPAEIVVNDHDGTVWDDNGNLIGSALPTPVD